MGKKIEKMNDDDVLQHKDIQYYSAVVNAHVGTGMERDKQLLTLSSLALGVIITFMQISKKQVEPVFLVLSGACFFITIVVCLVVLDQNKILFEKTIKEEDPSVINNRLTILDNTSFWAFLAGFAFLFLYAIIYLYSPTIEPRNDTLCQTQKNISVTLCQGKTRIGHPLQEHVRTVRLD